MNPPPKNLSWALEASGLTVRHGRNVVLDQLDLQVPSHGVTVILGRNGAGKSTLLRLALGSLKPDGGSLRVLGVDPWRSPNEVRDQIGFIPDRPDAPLFMNLVEWLRFLQPHYRSFDIEHALDLARRFDLPLGRPFEHLSRGEGMLAMWCSAIASYPALFLLDEPFGGLDAIARDDLLSAVITELCDEGRPVILTTHDLELAARIADRVVVVADGRVVHFAEIEPTADDIPIPEQLRRSLRATHEPTQEPAPAVPA